MLERRKKSEIKGNTVVNLIKAGCFDFENPNRAELLWQFDMSERKVTQVKNDYQAPKYEWNDNVKAEWEKEVLGLYLSIHPMEKYGFRPLDYFTDGQYDVLQGGEITDVAVVKDKNSNDMAFLTLDTLYGIIKVLVFSSIWEKEEIQNEIKPGNLVMVKGKRSGSSLLLNNIEKVRGGILMYVELVQATPNPIKLITDCAVYVMEKKKQKYPDKLFKHLFENGHHSTFEHAVFTFKIEDISRTCLAQLTRHRHASFSVRSQRYCDESEAEFITPPSIENNVSLDIYYHNSKKILHIIQLSNRTRC